MGTPHNCFSSRVQYVQVARVGRIDDFREPGSEVSNSNLQFQATRDQLPKYLYSTMKWLSMCILHICIIIITCMQYDKVISIFALQIIR